MRFGEKALRYGGVDVVLRVLSLYKAEETIGYGGILEIFKEAAPGVRQFLHYFPKVKFFLQADNFAKYIQPRLKDPWESRVTTQAIANTFFVFRMRPKTFNELTAFRLCINQLGARLVGESERREQFAQAVWGTSDSWNELGDDSAGMARMLWFLCESSKGRPLPRAARGDAISAQMLLDAPDDLVEDGSDDADEDPMRHEDYSFHELVRRVVARRAFDDEGLELLCETAGLDFVPQPDDDDTDTAARAAQRRSVAALSSVCRELAEDTRQVRRRLDPSSGTAHLHTPSA